MLPNIENIQAGILKGHGRNHSRCFFLHFSASKLAAKFWIASHVRPLVSNASAQLRDSGAYRTGRRVYRNTAVINFYLTVDGYDHLGLQSPDDEAFRRGLNSVDTNTLLNDHPLEWDEPYHNSQQPIHALLLVSDDSAGVLDYNEKLLKDEFEKTGIGKIVTIENGTMLRPNGHAIEHFGYADGVNPDTFIDQQGLLNGNWKSILISDPEGGHGSYMVFRKLEQNVDLFYKELERIGKQIGGPDMAGAQVIGRFFNGAPVASEQNPYSEPFDYKGKAATADDEGIRCPFHAHIRKANPRKPNTPHIVRRGIPYDYAGRGNDMSWKPAYGVGLLFICYQKSIAAQYEAIQQAMNTPAGSHDPLTGQPLENDVVLEWNPNHGVKGGHKSIFQKVVTMRGGAYFYAPSIEFFNSLDTQGLSPPEVQVNENRGYEGKKYGFGKFWVRKRGY